MLVNKTLKCDIKAIQHPTFMLTSHLTLQSHPKLRIPCTQKPNKQESKEFFLTGFRDGLLYSTSWKSQEKTHTHSHAQYHTTHIHMRRYTRTHKHPHKHTPTQTNTPHTP